MGMGRGGVGRGRVEEVNRWWSSISRIEFLPGEEALLKDEES